MHVQHGGGQVVLVDRDQFDELRGILGDELRDLVENFESDCRGRFALAQRALGEADYSALRRTAHTLKGGALGIAAPALAMRCRALEEAASQADGQAARLALLDVQALFVQTLQILKGD